MIDDEMREPDVDDPVVAEVRRVREDLFAQFNYDLQAFGNHLRELTDEAARAGHRIVAPPPARPATGAARTKKAG
jgi:hypothetical protein